LGSGLDYYCMLKSILKNSVDLKSRRFLLKINRFLLRRKCEIKNRVLGIGMVKGQWSKRLPQKWKWRWNRKSSNVWKQFRFSQRYNLSNPRQIRVNRSFMTNRVLLNMLMWRYGFNRKQLGFLGSKNSSNRLDLILVALKCARNISNARLLVQAGWVTVNGQITCNPNSFISENDIIQIRKGYDSGGYHIYLVKEPLHSLNSLKLRYLN